MWLRQKLQHRNVVLTTSTTKKCGLNKNDDLEKRLRTEQ